jgi:hypothetical protein
MLPIFWRRLPSSHHHADLSTSASDTTNPSETYTPSLILYPTLCHIQQRRGASYDFGSQEIRTHAPLPDDLPPSTTEMGVTAQGVWREDDGRAVPMAGEPSSRHSVVSEERAGGKGREGVEWFGSIGADSARLGSWCRELITRAKSSSSSTVRPMPTGTSI